MNDVLYLLTLVTALADQLLTAGMNFASETAPLGMQDLRWEWGYVFWLLSLASMAAMSILFKYLL